MSKPKRSSVQRYHDRVAGAYDDSYDDAYWQWHDALTWDHLRTFLPTDLSAEVIDLGCGTGKWGLKLLKSGFRVTFVDISAKILDAARAGVAEMGLEHRAEFLHADACDLSALASERFTLATAFGEPLGCASSPPAAMREARRILKPGGVLVATLDNRWACIDFYLQRGNLDDLDRFLGDGRTHWLTKRSEEQFPIVTYGPAELERLLRQTGFELADLIGKTVLPMRHYREHLEDRESRAKLTRMEKQLWRDRAAIGRAAHLQFAARRV